MNLHLHIGPGNHEKILLNQLSQRNIKYSYSHHYPEYSFVKNERKSGSVLYNRNKQLTWGIGSRLGIRKNKLIDFTYPLYDKITADKIDAGVLLFGWAQVSLNCFRKNKGKGINVLDYPIPHPKTWQTLLLEEKERTGIIPHSLFSNRMLNRMLDEIKLADFISIPSDFVRESFLKNGVSEKKLIFNSYGISTELFNPSTQKKQKERLEVIFIGSVEIRKGVHYLLEAFSRLDPDHYMLNLVGKVHPDFQTMLAKYGNLKNVKYLGAKSKQEVANILNLSDVMVMPSILEGLSLTILEAMSSGIPVISTYNAGGLGLIDDFEEGFLIDIRKPEAIIEKLKWCKENKEDLTAIGKKARNKILNHYSESAYGERFVRKILKYEK